jgi:dienelactone hydrolase
MRELVGAAVVLLRGAELAGELPEAPLREAGLVVVEPELPADVLVSDRSALRALDPVLESVARRSDVERERIGVVGLGRGGTLAFLLGCTRRVAAVVDVDGPVLYPALSAERPIQPLELALNLEGAFLGVFTASADRAGEIEELRRRLASAARPFELVVDPRESDLWPRVLAFLEEHLAPDRHE